MIKNKYSKIYYQIINSAKLKERKKLKFNDEKYEYYELHHILPSCIYPEYSNLVEFPDNGVLLTAREHFICHWLLTNMFDNSIQKSKLQYAFYNMTISDGITHQRNFTSLQFAIAKKHHIKSLSISYEERYGIQKSKQIKYKQSKSRTGIKNGMFGKEHKQSTKEKISKNAKYYHDNIIGKTNIDIYGKEKADEMSNKIKIGLKEHNLKITGISYEERYGKEKADQIKSKLSITSSKPKPRRVGVKMKPWSEESKIRASEIARNRIKTECQYCNRFLDPGNFAQFHGEKCKFKKS